MNIFIAKIENESAFFDEDESWHCCKVLRKRVGDEVSVIDGKGLMANGILELVSEKLCRVKLVTPLLLKQKRNYRLHLAIAPTKQIDRIEWMVEKVVEMGIDELSFIHCKNSERVNLKRDRIQKIVESATKQSLQAYLPVVNGLRLFEELMVTANEPQQLIAHCFKAEKTGLIEIGFKNNSTLVMIGPEGDFSKEEITQATAKKLKAISLGDTRLRTETAGLYVAQAANLLSQL